MPYLNSVTLVGFGHSKLHELMSVFGRSGTP
jgi:hypothetical protein